MSGKKYVDSLRSLNREALHEPLHALELVQSCAKAGFDETVELAVTLGVDPRKPDQIVRGTVALPSGKGTEVRIAVFAQGDAAAEAEQAGADFVGSADLAARVEGGFTDFDVAIASPDLMPVVGRLGKILGPRGLMPNPKSGTVTADVARRVEEFKAGTVEYRTDRSGNVHLGIGKASFSTQDLSVNLHAVMEEIVRARPSGAKGRYVRKVTVSSTMGPGVKVDPAAFV